MVLIAIRGVLNRNYNTAWNSKVQLKSCVEAVIGKICSEVSSFRLARIEVHKQKSQDLMNLPHKCTEMRGKRGEFCSQSEAELNTNTSANMERVHDTTHFTT